MKYFQCKNPQIMAQVALRAVKGESISYLSATYHVNPKDIAVWRHQLLQALHLECWMVSLFAKQPPFLEKKGGFRILLKRANQIGGGFRFLQDLSSFFKPFNKII